MSARAILLSIGMTIVLSSCGSNEKVRPNGDRSSEHQTATTIDTARDNAAPTQNLDEWMKPEFNLSYQPIELSPLEQVEVKDSWKLTKTQSFGQINGETVTLSVYQEQDEASICGAGYERIVLLDYREGHYKYMGCGNTSLESDDPVREGTLILLDYRSADKAASKIVHGAIDGGVNGPGLMTYYVYDPVQNRWYGFDQWGLPSVNDLDGDGTEELVFQFQGLHMNPPDVSIGRWNGPGLEISATVTSLLELPGQYRAAATVEDHQIAFSIDSGEESSEPLSTSYSYSPERLTRMDVR
ncbi:hypothetical protein DFQ01_103465 [Paenibacillus cellulosilyticus]|uniref:Lipoprotein n=1 Tax=Paenibacillus cellulosilyticus TaxID=375489 RepID=A0A2V2YZ61_9BACL|nr:hypothetical protein [Paenibacillus cellulosilyticus]PWW06561.1 hypothetical protein DFQ01_103465 [Paenibacillus cellulosilyticus]QKS46105.1 hypothetical protein HUB94_17945 [Paenibacillus cellulosilyticus]